MNKNNLLLIALAGAVLCAGCGDKKEPQKEVQPAVFNQEVSKSEVKEVKKIVKNIQPQKTNLYKSHEDRDIPLSAVAGISALPQNIKNIINKQIKDADVYYLSVFNDKVIILKEAINEEDRFTRHDFEVISVSMSDGKVAQETSFPRKMSNDESETEVWKYEVIEGDMVVPSVHTSLNEDGSIKTVEKWFYGEEEVKYKLSDGEGKTISLRKTTKSDSGNWRDDHVFYDNKGNTALNVSFVYENNHVARFTYYNSSSPETCITMVNEYDDADKTKETLYTSDYQLKNVFTSVYKDGEREEIKVFDASNNEVAKFLAE